MEEEEAPAKRAKLASPVPASDPPAQPEPKPEPRSDVEVKETKTEDVTKRKVALLLGYCGAAYQGMQINPGARTIEGELHRAMYDAGGIRESNFGDLQKIGWSRAARTDKGVSAVGQIICAKLEIPNAGAELLLEALNAQLPNDIRAFDIVKVTGGFNAKNSCTRRKYTYVLPTYLLAPSSVATAAFSASGITDDDVARSRELHRASAPKGSWRLKSDQLRPVIDELKSWRLEPETLTRMREALRGFIGTKNFWNFTSKLKATDASAMRYITSFECSDPFLSASGREWIALTVHGQSFLLHQIRKMVATAIDLTRGEIDQDNFDELFSQTKFTLPLAPSEGLFLEFPMFEEYNKRFGRGDGRRPLRWDDLPAGDTKSNAIESFKRDVIVAHIHHDEDEVSHPFTQWLHCRRAFPRSINEAGNDSDSDREGEGEGDDDRV